MNDAAFFVRSTIETMVECLCSMGITEDCPRHRALKHLAALEADLAYEKDRADCNFVAAQQRLEALKEVEVYTRGDYDHGLHQRLVDAIGASALIQKPH
ncbi:hypothetical protein [Geothrix alkalitolerans]|uniref:hypothetical protein n=1 Tax=Geothrix alkalitolerans TaxID=2922724 RepID=UPI001FAFB665|nr:hypothetical protein [Geothrix alkalitolerans]